MKRTATFITILLCLVWAGAAFAAGGVDVALAEAKSCQAKLKALPAKTTVRADWEKCIGQFEAIQKNFSKGEKGAAALFAAAKMRVDLYGRQKKLADVEAAIKDFNLIVKEHEDSPLADDALYRIGMLRLKPLGDKDRARRAFSYIGEHYPDGDMAPKAQSELSAMGDVAASDKSDEEPAPEVEAKAEEGPKPVTTAQKPEAKPAKPANPFEEDLAGPRGEALLTAVDVEQSGDATTVSLAVSKKVAYSLEFTETGLRTQSPPKLDILLTYTKASKDIQKAQDVTSPFLSKIKIKQSILGGGIKLIFVMAPGAGYEVKPSADKIVVRFRKAGGAAPGAMKNKTAAGAAAIMKAETKDGARPFVVVIDPGHGGDDTGAIGKKGTEEKDVTLAVAKRLAEDLRRKEGFKIYLTRDRDKTLTLEERNALAVSKKADIFLSVHANASTNRNQSGIETYFLNNASDDAAARLARRENKASKKKLSDVEHILSTMLLNYDSAESQTLAKDVQGRLVNRMGKRYPGVKNRSVRSALFYVLVGAKCPAILVETSFISNPKEEKLLGDKNYQVGLASSIADGVVQYLKSSDKRIVSL